MFATDGSVLCLGRATVGSMSNVQVSAWQCDRPECGHIWIANGYKPKACAKCKSRSWDRAATNGSVAEREPVRQRRESVAVQIDPVPAAVCGQCGRSVMADPRNPRLWYCDVCDRQLRDREVKI